MIGLNRPGLPNAQAAQDEPPAIRNLTKNQLYLLLSETYLLPGIESKGVNRNYLVGVFTDQNYRLNLLEYKRFEAELTPSQQKKTNLVNLAYILRKLNALLVETGRRPLGFPDFIIPEEGWLTKVARYIDRKNVMEFFQAAIDPMGLPLNVSERVHSNRTAAYEYLFEGNALLENQKVYHSVKDISESYRRIISRRIDLEDLEQQLNAMRARLHDEEAVLKSNIFKSATTIVAIAQHDNFNPDDLYMEGDDRALANRVQLQEVCRLLKYIYCTDSVLDRTQEVMDLTNNNFRRANN
jgi:hypothetical protein